ncbi:MAG: phage tail assembly protein [Synergistaceae bacterium]|nr:phage tail assembly protein [Synergistaceae bacterium]MBQ7168430.1 phage tail assembly protein [Synergistaceae bacterium]
MKLALTQPLSYKDTQLTELELDYGNLTGNDLIMAEGNYRKADPDGQLFGSYHMLYIAARACHVTAETLKGLCAKDYMRVINSAYSFFGDMASEVSVPEITDD